MGTCYYLVSPKFKTIFGLGKSFSEDIMETLERKLELQQKRFDDEEIVDTFEWTIGNIKEQKLKDMIKVVSFYDDIAWIIGEWKFLEYVFVIKFKKYDQDSYIITGYDENFDKLKKQRYKLIDDYM